MKHASCLAALVLALALLPIGTALAQSDRSACRIPAFRGAGSLQGADAEMHIVNTGRACTISNFGVPTERRNPAHAGRITRQPSVGTAEFTPPRVVYTPKPDYAGEDYFEYEADAKGPSENALVFRVRVKVFVSRP